MGPPCIAWAESRPASASGRPRLQPPRCSMPRSAASEALERATAKASVLLRPLHPRYLQVAKVKKKDAKESASAVSVHPLNVYGIGDFFSAWKALRQARMEALASWQGVAPMASQPSSKSDRATNCKKASGRPSILIPGCLGWYYAQPEIDELRIATWLEACCDPSERALRKLLRRPLSAFLAELERVEEDAVLEEPKTADPLATEQEQDRGQVLVEAEGGALSGAPDGDVEGNISEEAGMVLSSSSREDRRGSDARRTSHEGDASKAQPQEPASSGGQVQSARSSTSSSQDQAGPRSQLLGQSQPFQPSRQSRSESQAQAQAQNQPQPQAQARASSQEEMEEVNSALRLGLGPGPQAKIEEGDEGEEEEEEQSQKAPSPPAPAASTRETKERTEEGGGGEGGRRRLVQVKSRADLDESPTLEEEEEEEEEEAEEQEKLEAHNEDKDKEGELAGAAEVELGSLEAPGPPLSRAERQRLAREARVEKHVRTLRFLMKKVSHVQPPTAPILIAAQTRIDRVLVLAGERAAAAAAAAAADLEAAEAAEEAVAADGPELCQAVGCEDSPLQEARADPTAAATTTAKATATATATATTTTATAKEKPAAARGSAASSSSSMSRERDVETVRRLSGSERAVRCVRA